MFKLQVLKKFIAEYNIVSLTETHAIRKGTINLKNFKLYDFPDENCNYEYPRGGVSIFIREDTRKLVKSINKISTDFVVIALNNGIELINLYIPPINSVYYDDHSIGILGSKFIDAEEKETPLIAMGDKCSFW